MVCFVVDYELLALLREPSFVTLLESSADHAADTVKRISKRRGPNTK